MKRLRNTARCRRTPTIPCWIAGLTLLGGGTPRLGAEDFASPIRSLLEAHCVKCHGGEKTEGDADLTGLTSELDLLEDRRFWESVIEQVEIGEMPPEGPFPSEEERTRLAGWLRERFAAVDWSKYRGAGHVTLPRLTKAEYRNTMRDLLGVDLRAGDDLPEDGEGKSGFTNDRDSLSLTSSQLEQYFQSAERAIEGVLALTKPPVARRIEAESMERSPAKLEALDGGVLIVHPDHELKTEWEFPTDGWYAFRMVASALGGGNCVAEVRVDGESVASVWVDGTVQRATEIEAVGFVRAGRHSVTLQSRNLVPQTPLPPDIVRMVDDRARELAPRFSAFSANESPAVRKAREEVNHKAWGVQECIEWLRALGPDGDPRQIDLRRRYWSERQAQWAQLRNQLATVAEIPASELDRRWSEQNQDRLADNARLLAAVEGVRWEDWQRWQGKLFIERLEVSGPVRPHPPTGEWTLLDALLESDPPPATLLSTLLPKAFRRPVSADEVSRYSGLLLEAQKREETRKAALSTVLTAVLTSPRFLFREELPVSAGEGDLERALDDHAVASRLSYFLWQTMPDGELFDLAAAGLLSDPATLSAQADRMLDDEKAGAFFEAFAYDWLGIRELGRGIRPDPTQFPGFTAELAALMREETVRTLAEVFRGDRPVMELVDSPTVQLNETLARHYGIPGVTGGAFRSVSLPDATRGGLLGMGSVLVATSSPARTNPVRRGTWVLERLLGEDVGEPLPTAGELPGEAGEARGRTLREELDLHRSRADCARCHDRIDPIGFGLENYDAVGRWRDEEANRPVDASGRFPDGREFAGPVELKQILKERSGDFEENLLRRLMAHALGRELRYFDEPMIAERAATFASGNRTAKELIRLIVTSDPFRRQSDP